VHSLVFVIVPSTEPDIIGKVSRLVEGGFRDYDTFQVGCSCLHQAAFAEAWRQVDASIEGQRWLEDLQLARNNHDVAAEREILRQRYRRATSLERAHPQFGRVSEDCEICEGRGVYEVSRDPAQHHDWWIVGGRWNGLLGPLSGLGANVARLEDFPEHLCPQAVVTPEGDWHEGPSTQPANAEFRDAEDVPEDERIALAEWARTVRSFVERYRGHLAVAVDCHS
jgi:hypothetical protein